MRKRLFMETTQIPAGRTVGEITNLLVEAGARSIMLDYADNGSVRGVSFLINAPSGQVAFSLPARVQPIYDALRKNVKRGAHARETALQGQAERVAWRQILRWVEAQVALIQTGMVDAVEVFLPYQTDGKRTLYQYMVEKGFSRLQLAAPAAEVRR